MRFERAFTLMELLVVLLIIGILSTVALRTIDATRDRALFDQTATELSQLVQAITGNPDLAYDGRRVDFGFYGDVGRLPTELRELVYNVNSDSNWHGPYVRRGLSGDSLGLLYDAWGNRYTYGQGTGTIASLGNGKYPMTVRVADSLPQLSNNTVTGTITDRDNNPPGDKAFSISVGIHRSSGGPPLYAPVDQGGYFEFSLRTDRPVPIGIHRIVVRSAGGDSLSRWLTVTPRSQTVVDFRFSSPFRNQLVVVGPVALDISDSAGFKFTVVNDGTTEDTVTSLTFVQAPDTAYMRIMQVDSRDPDTFHVGVGQGGTAPVVPGFPVPANRAGFLELHLSDFRSDSLGVGGTVNLNGQNFRIRFSDGSEIAVTPTP
jgi:prepilin-type N-terminal cleavage/methylation domain-containing protein